MSVSVLYVIPRVFLKVHLDREPNEGQKYQKRTTPLSSKFQQITLRSNGVSKKRSDNLIEGFLERWWSKRRDVEPKM